MADVSIDAAVSSRSARVIHAAVWHPTDPDIGYWFQIDGTAGYQKTTDGGATWGARVAISTSAAITSLGIWPDWWTPGDSGTKIHCIFVGTTDDDVIYRALDTNGDTLGTQTNVLIGVTATDGRGSFSTITKTTSGYLYVAYDIDAGAERGFHRSTDGGATWSANLSTTFVEATIDHCNLYPAANTGDGNDCLALYHDASADALTLKLWDSSGAAASESATILTLVENTTDLVGQHGFSASIRHSDGHIICVADSERDTVTADRRVFDLNCTAPSTFSITEKTAITTDIDDTYHPAIFIDQTTNDLYVAFNGLRDGSETLGTTSKVYYTKSADNGTSWSAGSTAYMEGAAALVVQVWAPLMGPRFYVGWRVGTTLVGNKVNSLTFAADPNVTVGLTGIASTAARGSVLAALTLALTGVGATGAAGTLGALQSQAITGVAASSAVGLLGQGHSFPLTGAEGTGAVGTITAGVGGDLILAITGVESTSAVGTLSPGISSALTGNAGTSAVGTLALSKALALVGQVGTSATGSLTVARSLALTGVAGTSAVGSVTILTAGNDITLDLTGVSGASAIGVVLSGHGLPLVGTQVTASPGTMRAFTGPLRAMASSTGTITIRARSTGSVRLNRRSSVGTGADGGGIMGTYTSALVDAVLDSSITALSSAASPMGL